MDTYHAQRTCQQSHFLQSTNNLNFVEKSSYSRFFYYFQTVHRISSENGFWFDFRGDRWIRTLSTNKLFTVVSASIVWCCKQFELRLHSGNTKLPVSKRFQRTTQSRAIWFSFFCFFCFEQFSDASYRIVMIPLIQFSINHGSIRQCPVQPIQLVYLHRINAYVTKLQTKEMSQIKLNLNVTKILWKV